MANEWPDATYACINLGEAYAPKEIEAKSICINADIGSVLETNLNRICNRHRLIKAGKDTQMEKSIFEQMGRHLYAGCRRNVLS